MKLLRRLSIAVLCIGLAFSSGVVMAQDWQLPVTGPAMPGGVPAEGRQYIVSFSAIDADTGEEINTDKYNRPFEWYVPTYIGAAPNKETSKVKLSYRLAQWEGGIEGQWCNVTELIEEEMDIADGWNFVYIPLENASDYTIGICKEEKSDNNYLASLEVESGTLQPAFTPENTHYQLQLGEDADELTIHIKTQSEKAHVSEKTIVTPLSKGENRIGITVTAQDGTNRYYVIMVMCGEKINKDEQEGNEEEKSNGSGGNATRYNTSRDLANFKKVPHVASKVSASGMMISNSGLTAQQAVTNLTAQQKEQILNRLKQKTPYTSAGYTLTLNELKTATQSLFTDSQLSEILGSPQLTAELGINLGELVTTVNLKAAIPSFSDIEDTDVNKSAIEEAASLGILESSEDGKFYPGSNIKFEEALKALDRVLILNHMETMKLGRSTVELYIKDIDMTVYPYIGSIASKLQVRTTKNLGSKKLGDGLTRQEMAQLIYEVTEGKLEVSNEETYVTDISDNNYEAALNYVMKAGIMTPENDCIMPTQNLTKAETAAILTKLDKGIKNMQALEAKAKEDIANKKVITDAMSDPIAEKE